MRFLFHLCIFVMCSVFVGDALAEGNIKGFSLSKSMPANFKSYGYQVVSKVDGHPVRSGETSLRFEVRAGDCSWTRGWNDCDNDRERHELKSGNMSGEKWFHWSIYLPEDYPVIYPVKTALGQFHIEGGKPPLMFQNHAGGYLVDMQRKGKSINGGQILTDEEMRGKWSDILLHINWTTSDRGFILAYVNGESAPRFSWFGRTTDRSSVYYKVGIYRSFMTRRDGPEPTQVVYYDNIVKASSCEDASTFFDCKAIAAGFADIKKEFAKRMDLVKEATKTQGKVTRTIGEKKDEACKSPAFASLFPDKCDN